MNVPRCRLSLSRGAAPRMWPIALALAFWAVAACLPAEEPDPEALRPQLPEIESFYTSLTPTAGAKSAPLAEPEWLRSGRPNLDDLKWQSNIRSLPGLRKYDLGKPPRRRAWWKYPLYPVFGAPRDLIDGFFGFVGLVPFFNLPITGGMYELVPTQVLMRHPRDWHQWPGHRNANGHGWIDGEGWGYFSNLHETRFSAVDETEQEIRRLHNALVDQKIADANAEVARHNAEVDQRREAYVAETADLYGQGKHPAAVARLVDYVRLDPANRRAKAMLIASLVCILPNIAEKEWGQDLLANLMRSGSREVLISAKDELKSLREREPARADIPFYLVWINLRLGSHAEAVEEAARLVELDPGNVAHVRLRFEAAAASGNLEWAETAARQLIDAEGEGSIAALHARGRLAFLADKPKDAIPIYERLVSARPRNPRFHYLLAMAHVADGQRTGRYKRGEAAHALKRAVQLAPSPGEKNFYRKALRAAKLLRVR